MNKLNRGKQAAPYIFVRSTESANPASRERPGIQLQNILTWRTNIAQTMGLGGSDI